MNKNIKSYELMWKKVHKELVSYSKDNYSSDLPEIGLLAAIIVQSAIDKNNKKSKEDSESAKDYFNSTLFIKHSKLLKINTDLIMLLVEKAWSIEDSGDMWKEVEKDKELSNWDIW